MGALPMPITSSLHSLALEQIGVRPEVVMNHETYERGLFAEYIDSAITIGKIRRIISKSQEEVAPDWFPYNPMGSGAVWTE